jgi:spore coat polysaccharide biosynthesis predicted glycosyltransferase SpsG
MMRGATAAQMKRIMEQSDAAIVPPSSICWELARIGVPAAILGTADNQTLVERSLRQAKAAFPLGWHLQVTDGLLRRRIARFLGDATGRARAARRLQRLVDGKGVERVIEAMGL